MAVPPARGILLPGCICALDSDERGIARTGNADPPARGCMAVVGAVLSVYTRRSIVLPRISDFAAGTGLDPAPSYICADLRRASSPASFHGWRYSRAGTVQVHARFAIPCRLLSSSQRPLSGRIWSRFCAPDRRLDRNGWDDWRWAVCHSVGAHRHRRSRSECRPRYAEFEGINWTADGRKFFDTFHGDTGSR